MVTPLTIPAPPVPPLPLTAPEWRHLALRQQLREAAWRHDLAAVERIYAELEDAWWRDAPDSELYLALLSADALFDPATTPAPVRGAWLQAWVEGSPGSYHASLLAARHAWERACALGIASTASTPFSADPFAAAQQQAAALAGDAAAAQACCAMTRSPRPAAAHLLMLTIAGRMDEPAWLRALFRQRGTPSLPALHEPGADVQAHLARHGVPLLRQQPVLMAELAAWSACLPPRAAKTKPRDYWLDRALSLKPDWVEALSTYAHCLKPRRQGQPGDIDRFVRGPVCAGVSAVDRNTLRWAAIEDELDHSPAPTQATLVTQRKRAFLSWLQQRLSPRMRCIALGRFAHFTRYSLEDPGAALRLHVESVKQAEGMAGLQDADLHDFAWLMASETAEAVEGADTLFRQVLECAIRSFDDPSLLTLAAAAAQCGLWGFARDPAMAEALLQRTAALHPGYAPVDLFTPMTAARALWDGDRREACVFVTEWLAQHRVHEAAEWMYDIRCGALEGSDPGHVDPTAAHRWLLQALEEGSPNAHYNHALGLEAEGLDLREPANHERCRSLYQTALDGGVMEAAPRLAGLARQFGNADQQREMVDQMKRLVAYDDPDAAPEAHAEMALAYFQARGVPRSAWVGMLWQNRGEDCCPDHVALAASRAVIYGEGSVAGGLWRILRAFFAKSIGREHLPPKVAPQ
jgi:hypothetical protein